VLTSERERKTDGVSEAKSRKVKTEREREIEKKKSTISQVVFIDKF
jgi:hypothetical protein